MPRALAQRSRRRAACAAYRLAPENRYPAALDDALESYQYLLKKGYAAHQILLCGESAGGGLIYALCLKLRELGLPLPCGLIGISPWTDLTESGETYETNREADPSMTKELLEFYAGCYTDDARDPLCSPLFGAAAVAAVCRRGRGHARRHAPPARKTPRERMQEQDAHRARALACVCAL